MAEEKTENRSNQDQQRRDENPYRDTYGAKVLKRIIWGEEKITPDYLRGALTGPYAEVVLGAFHLKGNPEEPKDDQAWFDWIDKNLEKNPDGKKMRDGCIESDAFTLDGETAFKLPGWAEYCTPANAIIGAEILPEYLIDGLIAVGDFVIMYGSPGSLKSMLAMQMAMDVAGGLKFLEKPDDPYGGFDTTQAPVGWLDLDNGQRITDQRVAALLKARGLPEKTPFYYWVDPVPSIKPTSDNFITLVSPIATIINQLGIRLLCIDNLGLVSPEIDENSSAMQGVIKGLKMLGKLTNAAIILIHHPRKSGSFNGRAGDSMRGHSSIESNIDLGLLVVREEQSDCIDVKATKVRNAPVRPFSCRWTFEHKPGTDALDMGRFFGTVVRGKREELELQKALVDIITAGSMIDGSFLSKKQVVMQAQAAIDKTPEKRIERALEALLAEKKIVIVKAEKNQNNTNYYKAAGAKDQDGYIQEGLEVSTED